MYDYHRHHEELRLQILELRTGQLRCSIEKRNAVLAQRYDSGTELLEKQKHFTEQLTRLRDQLLSDYESMRSRYGDWMLRVRISSLLAEFGISTEPLKSDLEIHLQIQVASLTQALNFGDKAAAERIRESIAEASSAISEYRFLQRLEPAGNGMPTG